MVFLLRMQIFYRSENKNKANFPKEKSFGAATHHSGVVYKKNSRRYREFASSVIKCLVKQKSNERSTLKLFEYFCKESVLNEN